MSAPNEPVRDWRERFDREFGPVINGRGFLETDRMKSFIATVEAEAIARTKREIENMSTGAIERVIIDYANRTGRDTEHRAWLRQQLQNMVSSLLS